MTAANIYKGTDERVDSFLCTAFSRTLFSLSL